MVAATRNERTTTPALDIANDPDRLVSMRTVMALTGMSRTQTYAHAQSGAWETVQTGPRTIRVRLASVRQWIAANTRSAA
jgi:predicted DNA-binding transcriptional regulator AlpA